MKIEKNVPLPSNTSKSAVLRKLKKGESVVIDGSSQTLIALAKQVFGAYGHVTCRKVDNNSTRVWRIK